MVARGFTAVAKLLVQFPFRDGGLGLPSLAALGPAAYLGSWALVGPDIQTSLGLGLFGAATQASGVLRDGRIVYLRGTM